MRRLALPLLLAAQSAFGAIALDTKQVKRNTTAATTCVTPGITTTGGSGELMVVTATADAQVASPTISDTATLSWTRLGLDNRTTAGGDAMGAVWYATTSGNLSSDVVTVGGGASLGRSCEVLAFTGAGTPLNFTATTTASPSAEQATIVAGTGSFLVFTSIDFTASASVTAASGTTIDNQGSGTAANWYVQGHTTSTVTGSSIVGSSTTGHTYELVAAEVPAASGGGGGGTAPPQRSLMGVGQ